ncbi:MAG: secretion protein HlyD, partial [Alphaproteobacteria bacterium]|nr:secretion protein HlyD [Alphaproteobacteria bacterium]
TVSRVDPSAITKVSALGIEEQRVNTILSLEGDPASWSGLGHGFRVVVRISLWKGENLVAVPIGSLFRRGTDWAAYVVVDGKAVLRTLQIGSRNTEYAEVNSGLAQGDVVILHPSDLIADGTAVSVNQSP